MLLGELYVCMFVLKLHLCDVATVKGREKERDGRRGKRRANKKTLR